MPELQTFTAHLFRSVPLADETHHLEFEMKSVPRFGFVAGQWLSMRANAPDGEEITRAYSIASPPNDGNRFALCLNRVQDGWMSNHLSDMKEGDEIVCQGPFGNFILHPPMRDTIFIATGTGIAPIRSMLHWVLDDESRHQRKQLWLVFGNRTEKDIYYHDGFVDLAAQHLNFHYQPTLSRGGPQWRGLRGYVQEHVPSIAGDRKDMQAYVCGLTKMVKTNRDLLYSLGWDRQVGPVRALRLIVFP